MERAILSPSCGFPQLSGHDGGRLLHADRSRVGNAACEKEEAAVFSSISALEQTLSVQEHQSCLISMSRLCLTVLENIK